MAVTAGAPTPVILRSLALAGWGPLAGREWQGVRSTLTALVHRLPAVAGQGWTTAHQLALSAGLSTRWVRTCLEVLEALGVIKWRRGGIIEGRPCPSFIRLSKRALVALVKLARPAKAAAEAAHAAETKARIQTLRKTTVLPKSHNRRSSNHEELSASPLPLRGEGYPPHPSRKGSTMKTNQTTRGVSAAAPSTPPKIPLEHPWNATKCRIAYNFRIEMARRRGDHRYANELQARMEAEISRLAASE